MTETKTTIHELDFIEKIALSTDMATTTSDACKAVFKVAMKYGLDEIELLRLFHKSITVALEDHYFKDVVVPHTVEEIKEG